MGVIRISSCRRGACRRRSRRARRDGRHTGESPRSLGLSLREVGRALDGPAFVPSALVDDLIRQTRARIAAERELLARIDATEPAGREDVLKTASLLRALRRAGLSLLSAVALAQGAQAVESARGAE